MSYKELYIELLSNENSPFKDMDWTGIFRLDKAIGNMFNAILWAICKALASFLDACEEFANIAYNFLSFSGSKDFQNLYSILSAYWIVPFVAILAFVALRLVLGDFKRQEVKTLLRNMGILFFVVALLPTIFTQINKNIIGENFLDNIQGNSSIIESDYKESSEETANNDLKRRLEEASRNKRIENSTIQTNIDNTTVRTQTKTRRKTSDYILRCNVYDYWYLYNHSQLSSVFENWNGLNDNDNAPVGNLEDLLINLRETAMNYPSSSDSKSVSFSGNIFNSATEIDDGYESIEFFENKVVSKAEATIESEGEVQRIDYYTTEGLWNGFDLLGGLGKEHTLRYSVDFFNLIVQLIATAVMYFCIGYGVFKLVVELLLHQLFGGIIAAVDLTNGQRIKKFLSSILGIYIALILSAIAVMLYQTCLNYVRLYFTPGRGIIVSILTVVLCLVMIDVPNVIARYFNINTGARGGLAVLGAGAMLARNAGRMAYHGVRGGYRFTKNRYSAHAARTKEQRQSTEREQRRMDREDRSVNERAAFNRQRDEKSERERQQRDSQQQRFDNAQSRFTQEHGSDGNYEKYQQPISYNPAEQGSEQNRDAITQRAAAISVKDDFDGNRNSLNTQINSAANNLKVEPNSADIQNAKKINVADINDAKRGQYMSIATDAEANGGNKKAYMEAAEKSVTAMGTSSADGKEFNEFLADSSYNAKHATQIRAEAKKIQSASDAKLSDKDAYVQAMDKVSGTNYRFNDAYKEKIATAELRDNGSLRSGSDYDNRPNRREYFIGTKSAVSMQNNRSVTHTHANTDTDTNTNPTGGNSRGGSSRNNQHNS